MARRTREHVVGDRATSAVADVLARAGHASEPVLNDYGEDLLVQTSYAGQMDASRLWVQVKGTENIDQFRLKRGGFRLSVPFDHALRWARSIDLVLVVLWDVCNGVGWYVIPGRQVDEWGGITTGQRWVTLRFDEDSAFTPESADHLAWTSRIDHYRHLLLHARDIEEEEEGGDEATQSQLRILIALEFVGLLGMTERSENAPDAFKLRKEVIDRFIEYFKEREGAEDLELALSESAVLTVLREASSIAEGLALPTVLVVDTVDVLSRAMGLGDLVKQLSEEPTSDSENAG